MKHTKAPWKRVDLEEIRTEDEEIFIAEILHNDNVSQSLVNEVPEFDEAMANAHLIAAAPELLEALKAAEMLLGLQNQEGTQFEEETINEIKEAIAKAEGAS